MGKKRMPDKKQNGFASRESKYATRNRIVRNREDSDDEGKRTHMAP